MASAPGLPHDKAEWLAAQAKAVAGGKGKGLDDTSASKIELKQFLQLRVMWRVRARKDIARFSHGVLPTILKEAQSQLRNLEPWQEYLGSLPTSQLLDSPLSQKLGVFALVVKHQNEVTRMLKNENESRVYEFRKREAARYWPEPESTPSKPGRKVLSKEADEDPFTPIAAMTKSLVDLDLDLSPRTPLAEARALDVAMFPKAVDEQIVNTALIDFLIAITIHLPCPAQWSLHRKAFRIDGFEARVDGYLEYRGTAGAPQIKAIVEVKAAVRNIDAELSRVRMQEGAQMAAWIFSDEDEEGCLIYKSNRRRRILISQDRHQIFLTLAEYGSGYVNHLQQPVLEDKGESESSKSLVKGGKDKSKKSSSTTGAARLSSDAALGSDDFLIMNEFGPFDTKNAKDMRVLGLFVLALASQMCK